MSFLIYHFLIRLYVLIIQCAAPFNPKANAWIKGRKNWQKQLINKIPVNKKVVWMHCASLGEFEQGRPVFEALKNSNTDAFFLLTFFSPSGYEVRKNYEYANYVTYIPADCLGNAKQWIQIVKPHLAIFVKYEVWPGFMKAIYDSQTHAILISARFTQKSIYFRFYGFLFKQALMRFKHIFLQDENSVQLLRKNGFNSSSLSGDTRFDRVIEAKKHPITIPEFNSWIANKRVIVAGSVWPNDLSVLFSHMKYIPGYVYIIVPHETDNNALKKIKNGCPSNSVFLSNWNIHDKSDVIIVDKIGILFQLYSLAYIAYIGGGFGKGIHNTLEAIVWGKPVLCGPNYTSFTEARSLKKLNCLFEVNSHTEFNTCVEKLEEDSFYSKISVDCLTFIQSNAGATEKIMTYISTNSLL